MAYCIFPSGKRKFWGFTLIELLTVIGVIGLLLAILLPAVQAARSAVRRISCSSKMRQIGIAIHNYNDVHNQLPPSKWGTENGASPRHNILTFLLPYLELQEIYDKVNFSRHWSSTQNYAATKRDLPIFQCPEAPRKNSYESYIYYIADYAVAEKMEKTTNGATDETTGTKLLFDNNIVSQRGGKQMWGLLQPDGELRTIETISDGLSNTMMLGECSSRPFVYGLRGSFNSSAVLPERPDNSGDWSSNKAPFYIKNACGAGGMQLMNCTNKEEIYSFHANGANFLLGDGAVRFIQESIHPEQLISIFTATAGDHAVLP
ncbi:MAG: DUF1559 domain-containing protein [Planctomycetaceae bacterium]|nr:DUF1559 domain-containing protein [Planctomycetaceae bacterium]